jgi:hypothetical protein
MKYDRLVLNNELDSKNKYIKSENEHKLNIEKLKADYNLKSKEIKNKLEENLNKLKYENEKIEIEKEKELEKLKLDNINQINIYEEKKANIENEHLIDIKKKELDLNEKIIESINESKIKNNNHELEIQKEKNKTELEEKNLNNNLLINEKNIEDDKQRELLNIQYNQEEQFMIQQIEASKDEILLQMLNAQMMGNNLNQLQ